MKGVESNKEFFDGFKKDTESFFPSKKKMVGAALLAVVVNVVAFIFCVGIIAVAVKWVIAAI